MFSSGYCPFYSWIIQHASHNIIFFLDHKIVHSTRSHQLDNRFFLSLLYSSDIVDTRFPADFCLPLCFYLSFYLSFFITQLCCVYIALPFVSSFSFLLYTHIFVLFRGFLHRSNMAVSSAQSRYCPNPAILT